MSRISPLHLLNAALVCGLMLAVTDVVAQSQNPAAGGSTTKLVYTPCEQGHINKCGERSLGQHCTFTMQVEFGALTRSGGFQFGTQTCTSLGSISLYKDFEETNRTGTCYSRPPAPWDGSGWGRRGEEDEGGEYDIGTC